MQNLNKSQEKAYKILKSGANVFLTGRAGTGKTFVLNKYIEEQEKEGKTVIITAPTGIAALNLNGVTMHSAFGIPIPAFGHYDFELIPSKIKLAIEADIIVIDEISMCRVDVFEFFYMVLKKVKEIKVKIPQVIVSGDFYQLPPIVKKDELSKFKRLALDESGYAFTSPYWKKMKFKFVELTEIVRQKDEDFIKNLELLRTGDTSCLPFFNEKVEPFYPDDAIYICSTNQKADEINNRCLEELEGVKVAYTAKRTGFCAKEYTVDDNLYLKEGCKVVVMTNDVINEKYKNGSIGTVKRCLDDCVLVNIENTNEDVFIGFHSFDTNKITVTNGLTTKKKVGSFEQIPLKLAYAVTMHKTQGQTYEKAIISPSSFADGQLYVALSRVKSLDGLYLDSYIMPEDIKINEKVIDFYKNEGYEIKESIEKKKDEIYKKALEKFKEKKTKKKSTITSKTKKTTSKTTKKSTSQQATKKKASSSKTTKKTTSKASSTKTKTVSKKKTSTSKTKKPATKKTTSTKTKKTTKKK